MQFLRFTKYIAFAATLGFFSSCNEFLDVNDSPNAVLNAPATTVLVSAQTQLGFLMGSDLHRFTSILVQQNAGQGGPSIQTVLYDRYVITETDINNVWRFSIYGGALADMQSLIAQTAETSPKYAGISQLMQAYLFSVTTDAFGDIPYTQALQFAGNVQPAYDPSQQVYENLITLINTGLENIDKQSVLTPGADDLIYAGDMAKWRRFANTLKLRLYIHYFPKLSSNATTAFASLLQAGPSAFMTGTADNFQLAFEALSQRTNPIHQFETNRIGNFFPSSTLVDLMNGKADPRRASYFTQYPTGSGQYLGAGNGTGVGAPNTNFSRIGTFLRGASTGTGVQEYAGDAPIRMLTFAEYNFILAEYYARTGNVAAAQTSFTAGINASMSMAGVSTANSTAYIAARPALATLSAADQIRVIIEEKFVASYGVAVEPWTDWRRTKFPALTPPSNAQETVIPRILPYSDVERVSNPANTPARPTITAPSVFWDPGA
ncbi:SusD/RagB family nutrient-binding outer membrane lipoprotein [Hymenobacter aerilatus]|uniref:SusD/RagB family nutrient-binding outer membrane lipoprotein n=1 Tax=Hymenobacter aerilatus TaxID=2932251 RepID=A0A8T9SVR9_9BACT|nr:SusD/RagB family nutrient-binding outer membrane lipoprotein [Hymenobacter aerilatus]UOR03849.1 SusD/RagB family nutrient-binding outer membrane lipoprotein [Hymenobacter aerilatus]